MSFTIKQKFWFTIGFIDVPIGHIIQHTPEYLTLECLIQDPHNLRGLPVALFREDSWGEGNVARFVVFDGIVSEPQSKVVNGEVVYTVIKCVNSVWYTLGNSMLTVLKPEADLEKAVLTNVQRAVTASLIVPEAKFLYAELLRKDNIYPGTIIDHFVKSIMHWDAIELQGALLNVQAQIRASSSRSKSGDKDSGAPTLLVSQLEYEYEPGVKETASKGLFFGENSIVIDIKTVITNAVLDTQADMKTFFEKDPLAARLVSFFIISKLSISTSENIFISGNDKLLVEYAAASTETLDLSTFVKIIKAVSILTDDQDLLHDAEEGVGDSGISEDPEVFVNTYASTKGKRRFVLNTYAYSSKDSNNNFYPVGSVWVSRVPAANTFTYTYSFTENSLPKYLKDSLEVWITFNAKALEFDDFDYLESVKIAKALLLRSSFKRSGTNAGTLRYWNSRAREKILDITVHDRCVKEALGVVKSITKRAGLDIMRRQWSATTQGSLWVVLASFFNSYFLKLTSMYPINLNYTDKYGVVGVIVNGSMKAAPSSFIPLQDWMTNNFSAGYKVLEDDIIFIVKDKLIRELISDKAPPYVYDYKTGKLIPMESLDNIFSNEYLRSFYRNPVLRELNVDRSLLMAMYGQKKDSDSVSLGRSLAFGNDVKDVMTFYHKILRISFLRQLEVLVGSDNISSGTQPLNIPGLEDLSDLFLDRLKPLYAKKEINPSVSSIAKGILQSYYTHSVRVSEGLVNSISDSIVATQSFFPVVTTTQELKSYAQPPDFTQSDDYVGEQADDLNISLDKSLRDYFKGIRKDVYVPSGTTDNSDTYNYTGGKYSAGFGGVSDFIHKLDPVFKSFVNNYLIPSEGKTINPDDGNSPSFYGVKVDKLLKYANTKGAVKYDVGVLNILAKNYTTSWKATGKKKYDAVTYLRIVDRIEPKKAKEKLFFKLFPYMTQDEAMEITYRMLYRGDLEGQALWYCLLKGDPQYFRHTPLMLIFLDVLFQHGPGLVAPRFWRWINGKDPKYSKISDLVWALPKERLAVWRRFVPGNQPVQKSMPAVFKEVIKVADGTADKQAILDDLLYYRAFCLVDAKYSTYKSNFNGRWNRIKTWVRGLDPSVFNIKYNVGITSLPNMTVDTFDRALSSVMSDIYTTLEIPVSEYLLSTAMSAWDVALPDTCSLIPPDFMALLLTGSTVAGEDLELDIRPKGSITGQGIGLFLDIENKVLSNDSGATDISFKVASPYIIKKGTTTTAVVGNTMGLKGFSRTFKFQDKLDPVRSKEVAETMLYFSYIAYIISNLISTGDAKMLLARTMLNDSIKGAALVEKARTQAGTDIMEARADSVAEGKLPLAGMFKTPVSNNIRIPGIVRGLKFWAYILEGLGSVGGSRGKAIDLGEELIKTVLGKIEQTFKIPELYDNVTDEFGSILSRLPISIDLEEGYSPKNMDIKPKKLAETDKSKLAGYSVTMTPFYKVEAGVKYDENMYIDTERLVEMIVTADTPPQLELALTDLTRLIVVALGQISVAGLELFKQQGSCRLVALLRWFIKRSKDNVELGVLNPDPDDRRLKTIFEGEVNTAGWVEVSGGYMNLFWGVTDKERDEFNDVTQKFLGSWKTLRDVKAQDRWVYLKKLIDPILALELDLRDSYQDVVSPVKVPGWLDQGILLYDTLKDIPSDSDIPLFISVYDGDESKDNLYFTSISVVMDVSRGSVNKIREKYSIPSNEIPVLLYSEIKQALLGE